MVIDTLQPAAQAADTVMRLANELKRNIDSARRGHATNPRATLDALISKATEMQHALA
jgi:hypothetical protein